MTTPSQTKNGSVQQSFGKTLPDRLDASFAVMVELRDLLKQTRLKQPNSAAASNSTKELIDSLYGLVGTIERFVQAKPQVTPTPAWDLADLARALLAAEKGERFEPCIQQSIREYRMAYDNVRRYESSSLPEPHKADIVARFRQQLDCAEQSLSLLKVNLFEPACGEKIVPGKHRIVKVLPCESAETSETIASVISVGFEWLNDQGDLRRQPAEVIAYGELIPPPRVDSRRNQRPTESILRHPTPERDLKSVAGKRLKGE